LTVKYIIDVGLSTSPISVAVLVGVACQLKSPGYTFINYHKCAEHQFIHFLTATSTD